MLTVTQAAARLGLTPDRVRKLIIGGALKAQRLGPPPKGVYMIEEADLEAFAQLDRPRGKRRARTA